MNNLDIFFYILAQLAMIFSVSAALSPSHSATCVNFQQNRYLRSKRLTAGKKPIYSKDWLNRKTRKNWEVL
jgi:hypothetical protein